MIAEDQLPKIRYMNLIDVGYDDEYFWGINEVFGGLFKISREGYQVQYVAPLLLGKENLKLKVLKAVNHHSSIVYFPWNSNQKIIIYDKKNNQTGYINFPKKLKNCIQFCDIVERNGKFYLFPQWEAAPLLILDPCTWEFNVLYKWKDLIAAHTSKLKRKNFRIRVVLIDHTVWLSFVKTPLLLEVNLDSLAVKEHSFEKICNIGAIAFDGSYLWLAGSNEYKVICWDPKTGEINCYINKDQVYDGILMAYSQIICLNSAVILLPSSSKAISFVDKEQEEIRQIDSLPEGFQILKNRTEEFFYWGKRIIDNQLIVFPASGNMLLEINPERLEIVGHKLILEQSAIKELILQYYYKISGKQAETENLRDNIYSLDTLCYLITSKQEEKPEVIENRNIGSIIFSYIKDSTEK